MSDKSGKVHKRHKGGRKSTKAVFLCLFVVRFPIFLSEALSRLFQEARTTGSPAADAEPAAATRPAPTDKATNSRRDSSPDKSVLLSISSLWSSIVVSLGIEL